LANVTGCTPEARATWASALFPSAFKAPNTTWNLNAGLYLVPLVFILHPLLQNHPLWLPLLLALQAVPL